MRYRQSMEETDGAKGHVRCFLVQSTSAVETRKTLKRERILIVERDRLFVGNLRIVPTQKARVDIADLRIDSGELRVRLFRGEQAFERLFGIAERQLHPC